jgi:flagellum-specific peptidoglycan hydrolase FlgJ
MATIIDSLLVELGLDSSGMSKGVSEAKRAFDAVKREAEEAAQAFKQEQAAMKGSFEAQTAAAVKQGKITAGQGKQQLNDFKENQRQQAFQFSRTQKDKIAEAQRNLAQTKSMVKQESDAKTKAAKAQDAQAKSMVEGISHIRTEVIGLIAGFLGLAAIKSFGEHIIGVDGDVQRLSGTIGVSTTDLNAWAIAASDFGATGAQVEGAFRAVNKIQEGLAKGDVGSVEALTEYAKTMSALGGAHVETNVLAAPNLTQQEFLLQLAKESQQVSEKVFAQSVAKLGIDENVARALHSGNVELAKQLQSAKELAKDNDKASAASLAMQKRWNQTLIHVKALGETILVAVLPAINSVLDAIDGLIKFATDGWGAMTGDMKEKLGGVKEKLGGVKEKLGDVSSVFAEIKTFIASNKGFISALFTGNGEDIRKAWNAMWDNFIILAKDAAPKIADVIKEALAGALGWIEDRASAIWDAATGQHTQEANRKKRETAYAKYKEANRTPEQAQAELKSYQDQNAAILAGGKGTGASAVNIRPSFGASKPTRADAQAAADAAEKKYGVPAAVTLAQYQLESNSGKNMPAGSNNPFGIKAKGGQPYVEAETTEYINGQMQHVKQKFAKFDSLEDAFDAHAELLATDAAYSEARKHTDDPKAYADALTGKYATDPEYGAKLKSIMSSDARSAMPPIDKGVISGAQSSVVNNQALNNRVANNNAQIQTNVGSVNINAPNAKTNADVASLIGERMQDFSIASMANSGLA